MLIDTWGNGPIAVTGSAKFRCPSQRDTNENIIVIGGDTRVADLYFGEFMHIFDQLYSRNIVDKMKEAGTHVPDARFLKEKAEQRVPQHFEKGRKEMRRM